MRNILFFSLRTGPYGEAASASTTAAALNSTDSTAANFLAVSSLSYFHRVSFPHRRLRLLVVLFWFSERWIRTHTSPLRGQVGLQEKPRDRPAALPKMEFC